MRPTLLHWPVASLRTYLVAAILVATVPTVGVLVASQIDQQADARELHRAEVEQQIDAAAARTERELLHAAQTLVMLSGSAGASNLEMLARQWNALGAPHLPAGWAGLFVARADGRLVQGSTWPTGAPPELPEDARTPRPGGRPWVSGALRDGDRTLTAVVVPAGSSTPEPYFVGVLMDASVWAALLHQGAGAERLPLRLVDRQGRSIVAAAEPGKGPAATTQSPGEAGSQVPMALRRIAMADWTVVSESHAAPGAGKSSTFAVPLAGALACLLSGILLALYVARRVTIPLRQLALDGLVSPLERIAVREIALLRDALQSARARDEHARGRLQAKAEEFQTLFESSPIGLAFAQDSQCRTVLHNAAMDGTFGPAQGNDSSVAVLHNGVMLEPSQQPLHRAATRGEVTTSLELDVVVGGRTTRHVLASAVPLLDLNGNPRGAIGAVMDITERKLSEARLLSIDSRLRESQRLVDLAQQAGHVGFFYYHFEQDVLGWTPGQAKLFDVDVADEAGTSLEVWAQRIDVATRGEIRDSLDRMVASRSTLETIDFAIQLPNGSLRWLSNRLMLSYGASGEPLQLVGISLDVTEQKQAERERDLLIEREQSARLGAEAANRAKDEFLGMLGHELRNPLSAISSAAEVLERVEPRSEVGQNARNIIARQTRHLARLLDDLLDAGRVISGKIALSKQVLDLAPLVQRLVSTLQVTSSTATHTIEMAIGPGWIEGDPMRLEQVVNNLLANAVKYTPAGGRISVSLSREGELVRLEVRDTGVGIPETLLPRIFDLFVQGERSLDRRAGGLGIGLTLVQRLVELHGGRVAAESSPQGSIFRVSFPAVEAPSMSHAGNARRAARKRQVLVIEDNADARLALQTILDLMGHSVEVAGDGRSGLDALLASRPDIAIVDIGLPELTGLEVAKHARGGGYAGRLIAISGYGQAADVRQAMLAGFDAYLVKPIDASELERRMEDDD